MPVNSLTEVKTPLIVAQADVKIKKSPDSRPAVIPNSAAPIPKSAITQVNPELAAAKQEILAHIAALEAKAQPIPDKRDIDAFESFTHDSAPTVNIMTQQEKLTADKFKLPMDMTRKELAKEELHKYFVYLGVLAMLSGDTKFFKESDSPNAPQEYKHFGEFNRFAGKNEIFTKDDLGQMTNEIFELGKYMRMSLNEISSNYSILLKEKDDSRSINAKNSIVAKLDEIASVFLYSIVPQKVLSTINYEKK